MRRYVLPITITLVVTFSACQDRSTPKTETTAPISATPVATSNPTTITLTVLTYNVLADRVAVEARLPALLTILQTSQADIIALQEADGWFLDELAEQRWFRVGYHALWTNGYLDAPAGQTILSRFPIESWDWHDLPGTQGRTVVMATLRVNGRQLVVATTHLESWLDAGPTRAAQLDAIFRRLGGANDALLLGDFNFGDGWEPETSRIEAGFVDLWSALRPAEPGHTWDIAKSEMAKRGSFPGETGGRIDRILLRSSFWRPRSVQIVGDHPIVAGRHDLYPSDHFGLLGSYEWQSRQPP